MITKSAYIFFNMQISLMLKITLHRNHNMLGGKAEYVMVNKNAEVLIFNQHNNNKLYITKGKKTLLNLNVH